jgi:hypothetical protein
LEKNSGKYLRGGIVFMKHYDYVMLPNGFKHRIYSMDDIEKV